MTVFEGSDARSLTKAYCVKQFSIDMDEKAASVNLLQGLERRQKQHKSA
jgi:hypothetical protein